MIFCRQCKFLYEVSKSALSGAIQRNAGQQPKICSNLLYGISKGYLSDSVSRLWRLTESDRSKFSILIFGLMFLTGCSVLKVTGAVVGTAGKIVYTTAKVTGKTVGVTAKAAGKTALIAGKGVRTIVNMATGKHAIKLTRHGNSLTTDVLLNRKVRADLIVDTGASDTVISSSLARKLGISLNKGHNVLCQVADGRAVNGRQINIKEIRVGGARVCNVQAVVLNSEQIGNSPGLLGMSFLNNFIFKIDSEKELLILQKR